MIPRLVRALLVAALLWLVGCEQPLTLQQQIIATIRDMEASIEQDERRRFMQRIAPDFVGQRGQLNRDQLRALMVTQFSRYQRLQARLFPVQVEAAGEGRATARFRALVTGGPGWIPDSGQVYAFDTRWRLEDGEWLLEAADWAPVALDEALDGVLEDGL